MNARSCKPKVFVEGLEGGAEAFVVCGFAGAAVEDEGDDEVAFWVAEGGGGLGAAVAEGGGGGVWSELVGDGGAVVGGVEDDAEAPVDGLPECVVEHADSLAEGEGVDHVLGEDSGVVERASVAEHFVEAGHVVGGTADAGGGS